MLTLNDEARCALCAGRLAHFTTINADGSPQVSVVWTGLDGNDIVIGHLMHGRKVENIARDPRVALTVEAEGAKSVGMGNYLIVYGAARLVEGGAPQLLQRLAEVYLGPGVAFPPWRTRLQGTSSTSRPSVWAASGPGWLWEVASFRLGLYCTGLARRATRVSPVL